MWKILASLLFAALALLICLALFFYLNLLTAFNTWMAGG
jgi:hypothetical protein